MNAAEILDAARKLTDRAITIARGEPFGEYIQAGEIARLTVDGEIAVLRWPKTTNTLKERQFPAHLLTMDELALSAWQAEAARRRKESGKAPGNIEMPAGMGLAFLHEPGESTAEDWREMLRK